MSTASGFYLAWLRLTGTGLKAAEVTFEPGLNVIWGASNTGKSFIFSCIDFMLGRDAPPPEITAAKGYTTGWLGFVERASKKQRVLERDLQGADFRIHAAEGKEWAISSPETIAAKADPARTDTVSSVLLSTFGIEKMQVMRPTTKGGSRNVSFRDIAHFTFIEEERIIAKKTPVYPSMQRDAVTPELSMLSLLISGRDFSGMIKLPDMKVEKATWKGKNELYEQLIAELKKEVGDNPPWQKDITERVAAADERIVEVTTKIEESNKIIADLMKTRKTAWEGHTKPALAWRWLSISRTDSSSCTSTINRTCSGCSSSRRVTSSWLSSATPLPFCGEPLEEHSATQLQEEAAKGSIQEAATEESKKIAANVRDLEKTLAALRGEEGQLGTQVTKRQEEINNAEKTIRQELEPRIGADKKELAELAETRGRFLSMQVAIERLALLTVRHQALGKEPKRAKGTSAVATARPDTASLRLLSDEIAAILKDWRYMKTAVAEFDKEMDLVVAGEPRTTDATGVCVSDGRRPSTSLRRPRAGHNLRGAKASDFPFWEMVTRLVYPAATFFGFFREVRTWTLARMRDMPFHEG